MSGWGEDDDVAAGAVASQIRGPSPSGPLGAFLLERWRPGFAQHGSFQPIIDTKKSQAIHPNHIRDDEMAD